MFLSADCQAIYDSGMNISGVYNIGITTASFSLLPVFCDMNEKGWIVFQKRTDSTVDFFRYWNDYKYGFGNLTGNFWLGLEKLHNLAGRIYEALYLRIDVRHRDDSNNVYAEYGKFEIGNEADGYRLVLSEYTGTAGDSMNLHNNMKFTTRDRDNDRHSSSNCAVIRKGVWWYNSCYQSNLNALYPGRGALPPGGYMGWYLLHSDYGSIIYSQMKLRYK